MDRLSRERIDAFGAALGKAGGRLVVVRDEAEARAEAAGLGHDVGVDRADLLLADTGTVLRTYATREESRISLKPEVSVFLATPDRIVPGLTEALEAIAPVHRAGPAYTVLVTGPSRTADIEKELVIPAHGPRELHVILIEARKERP